MYSLPDLPAAVSRVAFATLCASFPRLAIDTPENRAARDEAAMIAVAALHPADGFEAKLAAEIVAADAWVMDNHRLAAEFRNDTAVTLRCRAEARCMMREMRSHLRELRRMQAERDKALAAMHPAAMERAGYWFKDVSQPEPSAEASPSTEPAEPEPTPLNEAESYASVNPDGAARIRAAGGVPADIDFPPPKPHIVAALVNGTSPILCALDHIARKATVPA
jgi:hypothetical protein